MLKRIWYRVLLQLIFIADVCKVNVYAYLQIFLKWLCLKNKLVIKNPNTQYIIERALQPIKHCNRISERVVASKIVQEIVVRVLLNLITRIYEKFKSKTFQDNFLTHIGLTVRSKMQVLILFILKRLIYAVHPNRGFIKVPFARKNYENSIQQLDLFLDN